MFVNFGNFNCFGIYCDVTLVSMETARNLMKLVKKKERRSFSTRNSMSSLYLTLNLIFKVILRSTLIFQMGTLIFGVSIGENGKFCVQIYVRA